MSVVAAEAEQLLQTYGRNELEEKSTSKLIIFLKLVIPRCQSVALCQCADCCPTRQDSRTTKTRMPKHAKPEIFRRRVDAEGGQMMVECQVHVHGNASIPHTVILTSGLAAGHAHAHHDLGSNPCGGSHWELD